MRADRGLAPRPARRRGLRRRPWDRARRSALSVAERLARDRRGHAAHGRGGGDDPRAQGDRPHPQDAGRSTGRVHLREVFLEPTGPAPMPTRASTSCSRTPTPGPSRRPRSAPCRRRCPPRSVRGLLDGEWGRGSQAALEAWSRSEFDSEPINLLIGVLLGVLADAVEREGWRKHHEPALDLSFALLAALVRLEERDGVRAWHDPSGALLIVARRLAAPAVTAVHAAVPVEAAPGTEPHALRTAERRATPITRRNGWTNYHRSDRRAVGRATSPHWATERWRGT